MFVPFDTLPAAARIWIFQADRPFTPEELIIVEKSLRAFTAGWVVHGSPFNTSFVVKFNQFIVLAADESGQNASECSIDSSVRVLKEIEHDLGVHLFDRNLVAFRKGDEIVLVHAQELKQKFHAGILNEDTLTFNNLVSTKAEFENHWLVPAGETWLKRFIPNPLAKVK